MSRNAEDLAALIRDRAGNVAPTIGLVLGSGLGHLADEVDGSPSTTPTCPGSRMRACRATTRSS
jgi:purine-nucleoside phosphorylase